MAPVARKEVSEVGSDIWLRRMAQQGRRLPYNGVDSGTKAGFRQECDKRVKRLELWLLVAHRWQWTMARRCQAWADDEEVLVGIGV